MISLPLESNIRPIEMNEISLASAITKSCKGLSRGFNGEEQETLEEWINDDDNTILGAIVDEKIIGICMMGTYKSNKEKVAWLRELAVHPNYQNRGIGRSLIQYGLDWAIGRGATQSFLATDVENDNAIYLYTKHGYVKQDGRGEIVMGKKL